ncbi:hypothetical protein EZV62_015650 [Acer yangbiense]|uniref:DUF4283 domain-containing protein n=1 Tax=Acer yangbiense TaxID=1000413 RepID=A0A5C7HLF2_9ROSI|nr:hypothetical protein EZV62_015650 [Acer yangbiense]
MGTNELASLCENLSIKDEDNKIHQISEGVEQDGVKDIDHCLVGKRIETGFGKEGHGILIEALLFWRSQRVIEIPMESKECWGKFLRVKVLIDILKPLKRWMGHGINECSDVEAKKEDIEGPMSKFESWLRASHPHKVKFKSPSQSSGGSSVNERSSEDLRETEIKGTPIMELSSLVIQKGGSESLATAASRVAVEKPLEALPLKEKAGDDTLDRMCVDGPSSGPDVVGEIEAQVLIKPSSVEPSNHLGLLSTRLMSIQTEAHPKSPSKRAGFQVLEQETKLKAQINLKEKGKKWKKSSQRSTEKDKSMIGG